VTREVVTVEARIDLMSDVRVVYYLPRRRITPNASTSTHNMHTYVPHIPQHVRHERIICLRSICGILLLEVKRKKVNLGAR
jgi:hypothetical protein